MQQIIEKINSFISTKPTPEDFVCVELLGVEFKIFFEGSKYFSELEIRPITPSRFIQAFATLVITNNDDGSATITPRAQAGWSQSTVNTDNVNGRNEYAELIKEVSVAGVLLSEIVKSLNTKNI